MTAQLCKPVLAGVLMLFLPSALAAQGLEYVKANYTKYEYRIPMRDGRRLFTAVYVPKDTSRMYPILLTRTPYSVQPYGADQYPRRSRPVAALRQGGLHLRLPGRARPLDVGGDVRQHAAAQRRQERAAGHRRKQRHLRHHRLAAQARAEPQRQGRAVGHLLSRLLHGGRHDRRPPGAQGGLAAGARHRLVHRRRLAPQRRPVPAAHLQLHAALRPAAAGADQEARPERSITTRPTATISSCTSGPLSNVDAPLFQGRGRPSGTR